MNKQEMKRSLKSTARLLKGLRPRSTPKTPQTPALWYHRKYTIMDINISHNLHTKSCESEHQQMLYLESHKGQS